MESTGREKEKEKEKGRWREENGGPVKCRWRVLGRGAVWRGALQFIFSIQKAPPPLLYCPSVWQLELAMWRGEQKRACCPAWVRGRVGRQPTFKRRANQAAHRDKISTRTLSNWLNTFFKASPTSLNTQFNIMMLLQNWNCQWNMLF